MKVNIFICGDIVNTKKDSGLIISTELEKIIKSADFSICNFEAPIENAGSSIVKSGPHIRQKKATLLGLKKQGFDLIQLANNHMMDFGEDALKETVTQASKVGLETVGAGLNYQNAYTPLIKKINGITFGIINACEAQFGVLDYSKDKNSSGYAWINHNQIDKNVLELKKLCDFILVLSHAGLENYSIPQKEWRERYRHLCDLGADIIIGTHPHVPQGYEEYNNSFIFYSLGNFYFDWGRHAANDDKSYSVFLEFEKDQKPVFKPIYHITRIQKQEVDLALPDEEINLSELSSQLKDDYEQLHNDMTLKAYESVRINFLRSFSFIPQGYNFKSTVKEILATALGRRKKIDKLTLSLHLLRNEAYYFVARNALELLQKQRYEK